MLRTCHTNRWLALLILILTFSEGIYIGYVVSDTYVVATIHDCLACVCIAWIAFFGGFLPLRHHIHGDTTDVKVEVYAKTRELAISYDRLVPRDANSNTAHLLVHCNEHNEAVITHIGWDDDGRRQYLITPDGCVYQCIRGYVSNADQAWLKKPLCRCRLEYVLDALRLYSPQAVHSR